MLQKYRTNYKSAFAACSNLRNDKTAAEISNERFSLLGSLCARAIVRHAPCNNQGFNEEVVVPVDR